MEYRHKLAHWSSCKIEYKMFDHGLRLAKRYPDKAPTGYVKLASDTLASIVDTRGRQY